MDDFSIYGTSFDDFLSNLDRVLQICEETNLFLNWEKCHFMVNEGIVLGHKISERGIEVDKAKVDAIEKMSGPKDIKGIRSCQGKQHLRDHEESLLLRLAGAGLWKERD